MLGVGFGWPLRSFLSLAHFLSALLQLLDELLQRGGVVGVEQQGQPVEQADALGIDSQLLQRLIQLLQFLLGTLRGACGISLGVGSRGQSGGRGILQLCLRLHLGGGRRFGSLLRPGVRRAVIPLREDLHLGLGD